MASSEKDSLPPIVALEEHFLSRNTEMRQFKAIVAEMGVESKVFDVGAQRIADMDAVGLSMQVLSHGAGFADDPRVCSMINDEIAAAVKANPSRFAGFAFLPMAQPQKAADELRRCIQDLGFCGALIDNHVDGVYFEGPQYDVFWSAAESLDAPIYLHPAFATDKMMEWYKGSYSTGAANCMAMATFGWHFDTATHVLRLYASGVFDRFPKLKIILGHFGESLPFWKERIVKSSETQPWGDLKRLFNQVYDENLWFTTSGVYELGPMACMMRNTRMDRIMFSIDYPFAPMELGIKWLKELRESGLVDQEQFEMYDKT
ncbi:hypothetical protein EDB80DRAFT_843144 [Ilyonectria destructans]|nr:hypothetical protein EDB80DRAFT_843144 [Ilyonectria destructans]